MASIVDAKNVYKFFAVPAMKRWESSFLESGLGLVISFGQWHSSKHNIIRDLKSACALGLALSGWVDPFYPVNKPGLEVEAAHGETCAF